MKQIHAKFVLGPDEVEVRAIVDTSLWYDASTPATLQRATGIANFTACRDTTRPAPCAMSDEDSERARRDNAHDLALYAYAERLAAQHVAKWGAGMG